MSDSITLRPGSLADIDPCSTICFEAFQGINRRHGFEPDFATRELAVGLMSMVLNSPHIHSIVAEVDGRVVGSCFLWEGGSVTGVGPVTVDPSVQARSVGRRMMERLLGRAREINAAGVRLVQAAFNTQSMSLYTKLGFDIREPLVCLQGTLPNKQITGYNVRLATENDVEDCAQICRQVHGHDRTGEVMAGLAQKTSRVVEYNGRIVGYASDIGFFGHAVALSNDSLKALISASEKISGPGMLLPSRNSEMLRWCLGQGLRITQPMSLMSYGLYNEPRGAFLPSILF